VKPVPAKPKHRDAIVQAAVTLFRRHGYAATGLADIVASSGAPKGSLYHYFPGGKAAIAEAAVRVAGATVTATLSALAEEHPTAGRLVRAYGERLAGWMAQSGFTDGSPITTTLLETAPADAAVARAGREALADWRAPIAAKLVARGCSFDRAARLAGLAIGALEGALIQARAEADEAPIRAIAQELERLLDAPN
jgi:TetR/AcrR family transcriptional repressor of lmrAB and yxaGH operons